MVNNVYTEFLVEYSNQDGMCYVSGAIPEIGHRGKSLFWHDLMNLDVEDPEEEAKELVKEIGEFTGRPVTLENLDAD